MPHPARSLAGTHPIVGISASSLLHRHTVVIHTLGLGIRPPRGVAVHSLLRQIPGLSPCRALWYT